MGQNHQFHGFWIKDKEHDYGQEDSLYYQDHRHTLLKKTFTITKKQTTLLYVGALGYYIGYINNKRIGNDELNSDWTNHQKCVYYDVYDVTDLLVEGENEIIFELGNGMYNPSPLKLFGKYNLRERLHEVGEPSLICDLVSQEEVILSSDASWQAGLGQILFNNLYLGETIDFHLNDPHFHTVQIEENTRYMEQSSIPKIKTFQSVKPKLVKPYLNGLFVDFGEMISGFLHLSVKAFDNQKIIIQYSENVVGGEITFDTSLAGSVGETMGDFQISGGLGAPQYAIQTDTIICKDGINDFENKFTYHSFRYAYITGCKEEQINDLYALYVHTGLRQIGNIETDNDNLNDLFEAATRTKLNNVHSVFEDCARERLGYGGDIVALATSNLYTFDLEKMYYKVIKDFRYEQTENGGVPETAPYMGIQSNGTGQGEGPLLWQLVYPYLTYKHYQYYGDKKIVEQEYPYIQKQVDYLLNYDLEKLAECCLGDHGSILIAGQFRKPTPDKLLLGYCSVLLFLKYNILIRKVLQKDVNTYQEKYNEIKALIISKFKNEDGSFGEGTQSGYAFSILLELDEPTKLCQKFVEKIKQDQYVLNSGIFGMSFTYEILNCYGYDEIIEKWLLQDGNVSFKKMLSNGNQALAELFIGEHMSLNHAMFASYQQWYYQGLAGIQIQEDAVAFNKVRLSPYFSKNINDFKCEIETKQGIVQSSWKRKDNFIYWHVTLPDTIQYHIHLNYDILQQNNIENSIEIICQDK